VSVERPRRVALVIGQLTRGGAEGQLAQLVRHVDRARYEPFVYCLSAQTAPLGSEITATGTCLRVVTGNALQRARQLAQLLDADEIDIIHTWLYVANAVAGVAHLRRRSRPLITSARNCKVQGRVNQLANVVAFRSSRAIIANSRDVAAYITRHYAAPAERIRVIYNSIDIERFHPGPRSDTTGPIVAIGRLVEQKNHDLFLRAAAALNQQMSDTHFLIVGDGPLRDALEKQARGLGIAARVSFTGERGDVDAILRTASLFWLTSRWEGMPNVVLEAMASGVPVIATDVGGTRELIRSGVDGFVVPPNDGDAFVRHSQELLANADTRQTYAAAARARAEMFSTAHMVAATTQLYDEVMP
jgi:glycosyltransferase involved in cell wall biosynthesis